MFQKKFWEYSELGQTSKMERFAKLVNNYKLLTISAK